MPSGVQLLRVEVWGGGAGTSGIFNGGQGGFASAEVFVSPGTTIAITVGGGGAQSFTDTATDGGLSSVTFGSIVIQAPGGHAGDRDNGVTGAGGPAGTVAGSSGAGAITNVEAQAGATLTGPDPDARAGGNLPGAGGCFNAGPSGGLVIITEL